VTLIFDLLTSKSNQFILLSKFITVVNLVKVMQAVYKTLC